MLTLPSPRLFRRATVRRYANHIEFAYTVPQIFHRPLALRSVLRTLPWNLPFSDSHAAQLTEASANHTVFRLLHGTSYGRIRTLDHQTIPSDTAYGNFRTNDYERPPQRPISRKHPHNQPPKHGSTPMMLVPLPPHTHLRTKSQKTQPNCLLLRRECRAKEGLRSSETNRIQQPQSDASAQRSTARPFLFS
ncbi:hypothetical protein BASA_1287 [Bifidobacterium animalis subsp. animalis]|nr:hypothetical protein BASA_1287 [Bifidobacterium animalis subsp. animalis]